MHKMKRILIGIALGCCVMPVNAIEHRFACADYVQGKVCIVAADGKVEWEFDKHGKLVREIPAAGGPHSAIRLAHGNTLIACGDGAGGSRVFEVDPTGKTVWEIKNGDLPGIPFYFMTGLQRLPNGNTLISNWLGHGHLGQAPHLIEVTPAKQVVWTYADHQLFKTVSSVQWLDAKGDAAQGGIAH
jgi:outer membrane protein assembly factor BamB